MKEKFAMRAALYPAICNQSMRKANCGGPFGAMVVRMAALFVGRGWNQVTATNDPTAHAELITAIRDACKRLKTFQLEDCELYASCEPCPICVFQPSTGRASKKPDLLRWAPGARTPRGSHFDDDRIYREVAKPMSKRSIPMKQLLRPGGVEGFCRMGGQGGQDPLLRRG